MVSLINMMGIVHHSLYHIFSRLERAIARWAHIIGYLYWSLVDNYEWLDNYKPEGKFGLFRIDRNTRDGHPEFNRQITKGAEAFKLIVEKSITEGVLDSALSKAKERFGSFTSDGSKIIKDL